ncbi:MAG: DUF4124 domain-containing protein [Oleispira sp.]|nr:DUF4124 domain-containing protein [Oleispira sp.]
MRLLLLFLFALPLSVVAEPAYYTWVDAQGVVHNTLITSDKKTNPKEVQDESLHKESQTGKSNDIDIDDYPSEEQYQKNLSDKAKLDKPFYTWTDAQGIVRSEAKPDMMVEFTAAEVVYDAVFAPPFRLPEYVTKGECCETYASAFSSVTPFKGSVSYQVDDTLFPFKTQSSTVAAGYFSLPELMKREVVSLKAYKLPENSLFEVIALDQAFKPLYLSSGLKGLFVEQTWKDLAYKKLLLEISDTEIKYLIVFAQQEDALHASGDKRPLSGYTLSVVRDLLID